MRESAWTGEGRPREWRMIAASLAKLTWEAPITILPGVGPERSAQLERLGITTVGDLLLHGPRRYEDRRHLRTIAAVREKGAVTVCGRVMACGVKYFRRRTRSVFEVILEDGTGRLHCRWWNMPFLEDQYAVGQELLVYGRVVELRPLTMDHPETEGVEAGEEGSLHVGRVVPIYPLTEGLSQRWLRGRIWQLVEHLAARVPEPHPGVRCGGMPSRAEALRGVHFPGELAEAEVARRRLAFDEFVELQVTIQSRRRRLFARVQGRPCGGDNRWIRPFLAGLGFELTAAQKQVLRAIRKDLSGGRPMRRLVQGDVGSGKTVVAALAALMTLESGFGVALMAPTEILAQQHAAQFRAWFEPLGLSVALWTGSVKSEGMGAKSRSAAGGDGDGEGEGGRGIPAMVVGTHALVSEGFAWERLGLVIIDEQHKFGVSQREALLRKGHYPHLLVMTATPIPRTLALTLYGDLDASVMVGAPPGRGRVRTFVRARDKLGAVWKFVRDQLGAGRQAYVVFPRVEDDGAGDLKAVIREHAALKRELAPFEVAGLHGRLPPDEKASVMSAFRQGQAQVLVTTLVIEVGVDVPNATVMVIENAERFGLAQLHQLRGRIGRSGHDGYCILVTAAASNEAQSRLKILEECMDGLAIAEADLRLRGPGEFLGQAQSGIPPWRFADLTRDRELLEAAHDRVMEALDGAQEDGGASTSCR